MKNATDHPIRWSVQSVTHYDTASAVSPRTYNRDFWAFAPLNANSAYVDGYRVRLGFMNDPAYSVQDGLFALHYLYLEREIWLDSPSGWLTVMDGSTQYAMVERFSHSGDEYPGKATVIFYTNGPALEFDDHGMPRLISSNPTETPYYMEAEVNSPLVLLKPGETYALDTKWFPTRLAGRVQDVNEAGIAAGGLTASQSGKSIVLSGSFGVFFPGRLTAYLFDSRGGQIGALPLQPVNPLDIVEVKKDIPASPGLARVSVRLTDEQGIDRGLLGEAMIVKTDRAP